MNDTTDTRGTIKLSDDEIAMLGAALDLYIDDRHTFVPMPAEINAQIEAAKLIAARLAGVL